MSDAGQVIDLHPGEDPRISEMKEEILDVIYDRCRGQNIPLAAVIGVLELAKIDVIRGADEY